MDRELEPPVDEHAVVEKHEPKGVVGELDAGGRVGVCLRPRHGHGGSWPRWDRRA